ncbi:MAG: hypothetical protein ACRD9W_05890 [Terriglobia bacterium]
MILGTKEVRRGLKIVAAVTGSAMKDVLKPPGRLGTEASRQGEIMKVTTSVAEVLKHDRPYPPFAPAYFGRVSLWQRITLWIRRHGRKSWA